MDQLPTSQLPEQGKIYTRLKGQGCTHAVILHCSSYIWREGGCQLRELVTNALNLWTEFVEMCLVRKQKKEAHRKGLIIYILLILGAVQLCVKCSGRDDSWIRESDENKIWSKNKVQSVENSYLDYQKKKMQVGSWTCHA